MPSSRLGPIALTMVVALVLASCTAASSGGDMSGPGRLVESPERFGIDIQAAGDATIPSASLADDGTADGDYRFGDTTYDITIYLLN